MSPIILCIESSSTNCSVSLFEGTALIDQRVSTDRSKHNGSLSAFAYELLSSLPNSKKLSAVAVSDGPGSYTGLRIGASLAKGICYSADVPLIEMSSLLVVSEGLRKRLQTRYQMKDLTYSIVPIIRARKSEIFFSEIKYLNGKIELLSDIQNCSLTSINGRSQLVSSLSGKTFYYGGMIDNDIHHFFEENFKGEGSFIDSVDLLSSNMIDFALEKFKHSEFADLAYWTPSYFKEYKAVIASNKVIGTKPNTLEV